MSIGEQSWNEKLENYVDGYNIRIVGTTATAAMNQDISQPVVVYAISVSVNPSVGSGDVSFRTGPGTATAGSKIYGVSISSAASQIFNHDMTFPKGLVFASGVVVSATTVTGDINITYKQRYS